jgi:hypothetical protein
VRLSAVFSQVPFWQMPSWHKIALPEVAPDICNRYYDTNGNEMTFNAGITWIQVVDSLTKANY